MTVKITTPYFPLSWRSNDREPLVPMVEIPRALALDLVRYLSFSAFVAETSEEDCEAGLHEQYSQGHDTHMEALEEMVSCELSEQGVAPTAEAILRALGIAYEATGLIGKHGMARMEAVRPLMSAEVDGALAPA